MDFGTEGSHITEITLRKCAGSGILPVNRTNKLRRERELSLEGLWSMEGNTVQGDSHDGH